MSGLTRRVRPLVAATATLVVLTGTAGFSASAAPSKAAPKVTAIDLPASSNGVGVNTKTHAVYVSSGDTSDGSITVIDGKSKKVTRTIASSAKEPDAVAVNPKTDTVYVTNLQSKSVSVISGRANAITHTIKVGGDPDAIAVNPQTNTVYVTNNKSNSVSVIKKNKVTHTIKVARHPDSVAVDPKTDIVFVSFQGPLSGNGYSYHAGMAVISGKKNKVTRLVKPASEAGKVADGVGVDPTTDRVYLLFDYAYGDVLVYSGATDKLLGSNTENTSAPDMVAVNPTKHVVAVGSSGQPGAPGLTVYFLNGKNDKEINTASQGSGATAIAIDPSTDTTYVSSNDLYDASTATDGGGILVIHGT